MLNEFDTIKIASVLNIQLLRKQELHKLIKQVHNKLKLYTRVFQHDDLHTPTQKSHIRY